MLALCASTSNRVNLQYSSIAIWYAVDWSAVREQVASVVEASGYFSSCKKVRKLRKLRDSKNSKDLKSAVSELVFEAS